MNKIYINKNQFSDLLNLVNNVFFPLKKFVNKDEFLNIIQKKKFKNSFFPFPIFFGLNKKIYYKIKDKKKLDIFYKNRKLLEAKNIIFYDLDKKKIAKKIYGKNYLKHPFYKKFINENYRFLSFDLKKINKKNMSHKYFISPMFFKKKFKIRSFKNLSSIHTRNVPHTVHQWIYNFLFKKFGALLIQPLVGQYKKNEYNDQLIVNANKIAAKIFKSKRVMSIPFFSYPRYAGYREAALHAIVRKNYGCTHFWVGRDHAGYKKFYSYMQSQNFCKKNQKRLKIKIVAEKEPFYCNKCKLIKNRKCQSKSCKKENIIKISGSHIRDLLKMKKKIPNYLMSPKISSLLSKNSLIN